MSQGVSSSVANIALAVGIAVAIAIAVAFSVTDRNGGKPVPHPGAKKAVYLRLPPPVAAAPITRNEPVAAAPIDNLRTGGVEEPYEPPPPPTVEAAASPNRPAREQIAALTPIETAPSAVAPPPLRTVELQRHEIHAVPPYDQPMHPVTIVNREDRPTPTGRAPPKQAALSSPRPRDDGTAPARTAKEQGGVRLAGPAIVTAALELNVAGKPLRLYGVKPPASGDMCAPSANYAARLCPDVSRQALAARVGKDGEVTCRILATGGRQALPATCTDSTGTDLATYLVEHGFALADPNDMVDYSAAETHAKDARTGLWSYR